MTSKPNRNYPCPCDSGIKYKQCCLGMKGTKEPPADMPDSVDMEQYVMDHPLDFKAFTDAYPNNKLKYNTYLSQFWNPDKVKVMSTDEIIANLKSLNVYFDLEIFKEYAKEYISAYALANAHYYNDRVLANPLNEDFTCVAIAELWNRFMPDYLNLEMIDNLMQDGYKSLERKSVEEGLEQWCETWSMIRHIVPSDITSLAQADEFIPLTQFIRNWCSDFEMELYNAGLDNKDYFTKRILFCHDLCHVFPDSDELIIQNMLRSEADSYASIGDIATAEKLFGEWIEKFPSNAWGYIGWGDIYAFGNGVSKDNEKAREIYNRAFLKCSEELEVVESRLSILNNR